MKNLFKARTFKETKDRIYGIALRFLGIDLLVSVNGWINDWTIFDLRIIRSGGCLAYLQILGFVIWIGRNEVLWLNKGCLVDAD